MTGLDRDACVAGALAALAVREVRQRREAQTVGGALRRIGRILRDVNSGKLPREILEPGVYAAVEEIEWAAWAIYPAILEHKIRSDLRGAVVAVLRHRHWVVEAAVDDDVTHLRVAVPRVAP